MILNKHTSRNKNQLAPLLAHCLNHSRRDKNIPATDNATRSDENDLNRIAYI